MYRSQRRRQLSHRFIEGRCDGTKKQTRSTALSDFFDYDLGFK